MVLLARTWSKNAFQSMKVLESLPLPQVGRRCEMVSVIILLILQWRDKPLPGQAHLARGCECTNTSAMSAVIVATAVHSLLKRLEGKV